MPVAPRKILRLVTLLALAGGLVYVLLHREAIDPQAVVAYAESHSWAETSAAFLAVHVVASLFFIPRLFLGIAAGVMFGAIGGSALSLAGGVVGAMAGFVAVRFVNAGSVRLREAPAVGPWLERAERQGWRLVFVVRLVPVLPHSLVNYVFGLSRIGAGAYAFGSALGMVPTAIVYANLGATGGALASGRTGWDTWALMAVWGFGLLFVSWLLPKLVAKLWPDIAKAPEG